MAKTNYAKGTSMSEPVNHTMQKNAARATAIRESLALTGELVESVIAASETTHDVYGAQARLRKIQRILLETESRLDEVINP
jgi:hypothetical protein